MAAGACGASVDALDSPETVGVVGAVEPIGKSDTRRRLLDAARLGISRFGTRKLSMTDVAEIAGVSRRTLYRYFPSMAELLQAVAEDETQRYDEAVASAIREHPPGQRVDAVIRFMTSALVHDHLQQLVDTEPGFVIERFAALLPVMRESLATLLTEEGGEAMARAVAEDAADGIIRLAMSHYLLPDGDPTRFERSIAALARGATPGRCDPIGLAAR